MRVSPEDYQQLDLRAHSLLADVPLHDVWAVELPGGRPDLRMVNLRAILSVEALTGSNAVVRMLFRFRAWLGSVLGWDRDGAEQKRPTYLEHLSAAELESSQVEPGTREPPFSVLLVLDNESISEAHNATVHAFSVFALARVPAGHRLYWAIYVKPVGALTGWYMALIDPFRRYIVYPAALRQMRKAWHKAVDEGVV